MSSQGSVENIGAEGSTFQLSRDHLPPTDSCSGYWSSVVQRAVRNDAPVLSSCLFFLIPKLIPLGWVDKTWGLTHLLSSKHAGPPTFLHHYILQL